MRKLKFRAYSKSHNKMFDNELLENAADGLYNVAKIKLLEKGYFAQAEDLGRGIYLPTKDNDLVFMEYTGLIDRNGKEIYEGDILRHFKREKDILLKIEISPSYGVYAELNHGMKRLIGRGNPHLYYEVIGNIYENPELLG